MTNLIVGTRTVDLKAEECKCGGRYHFIDADAGVDVDLNIDLNVDVYLGTEIKCIVSGSFLSSSARCCFTCCRIAVTVIIEV